MLEERVREEVERLSRRVAPYKRPGRIVLRFDEFPRKLQSMRDINFQTIMREETGNRRRERIMAAYIIFDVEVTDPTAADDYLKLANESLTPFQSKTIVHGGVVEVLEGDWEPERVVAVEFESMEQARQWYMSPAYTKAKDILRRAASCNVILVEGV